MIEIKGAVTFPSGRKDKLNVTYNTVDMSGQSTSSLKRASIIVGESEEDVIKALETIEKYVKDKLEV